MKKLLKNKVALLAIIIVLIAAGYWGYQKITTSNTATPQYITAKAEKGTLVVSVTSSGQISASNETNIQAQTSGIVASVEVANNQKVKAGQVLVILDTTNDERAVRNAKASLQSAQLSLQNIMQPAATSTLLQSQQAVFQAQQSLQTNTNNLTTDYNTAYTDISNTFIDLPGVVSGLYNVLYSTAVNKAQADVDAYTNLINSYEPDVINYNQAAVTSYQTANTTYNQSLNDYKNSNIYSSTSTIESLLNETYNTLKSISAANNGAKNLLDLVSNVLQQNNSKAIPSQLNTDETSLQSYIATINSHLATIIQIQNSIQNDKQAIASANLSISQTSAALEQLQGGPSEIQIEQQKLAVTQAQNALTDAEQNLAYDYVRAPFDGIVTNITAKVAQPASGALATLVGNTQLAQATFNEIDVVNIKVGQKATVTFGAIPNLTLTGTVSEVDTIGTVSQGVVSYNVQVALDVSNPEVKPGMSDDVSIITNVKPDTLLVPNSAVTTRQNTSSVEVVGSDGTPHQTSVTIGLSNDTMTEILSGLNEGDAVVTQTITAASASANNTRTGTSAIGGLRIPGLGGGGGR